MIALTEAEVIRLLVGIPTTLCVMALIGKRIVKRLWAPFDSLNETSRDTDSVARPPNRPTSARPNSRPRPIAVSHSRSRPMGDRPSPSRSNYDSDVEFVAAVDAWRAGRAP